MLFGNHCLGFNHARNTNCYLNDLHHQVQLKYSILSFEKFKLYWEFTRCMRSPKQGAYYSMYLLSADFLEVSSNCFLLDSLLLSLFSSQRKKPVFGLGSKPIHLVLGYCDFQVQQTKSKLALLKSLVTKNACVKEFLHFWCEKLHDR